MEQQIEKIEVVWPDGKRGLVLRITPRINTSTLERQSSAPGMPWFELPNGEKCNRDGEGFIVVSTQERLRRV